jgi:hypothetical protein
LAAEERRSSFSVTGEAPLLAATLCRSSSLAAEERRSSYLATATAATGRSSSSSSAAAAVKEVKVPALLE